MGIFRKTRVATFLYGAFVYAFFFSIARAQGFNIENPLGPTITTFADVINAIVYYATRIITPISVLMLLYAALLYLFSAGNAEKVTKAHRAILWALVGIGIVLVGQGWALIIRSVLQPSP